VINTTLFDGIICLILILYSKIGVFKFLMHPELISSKRIIEHRYQKTTHHFSVLSLGQKLKVFDDILVNRTFLLFLLLAIPAKIYPQSTLIVSFFFLFIILYKGTRVIGGIEEYIVEKLTGLKWCLNALLLFLFFHFKKSDFEQMLIQGGHDPNLLPFLKAIVLMVFIFCAIIY
jgi:hypothetical protein